MGEGWRSPCVPWIRVWVKTHCISMIFTTGVGLNCARGTKAPGFALRRLDSGIGCHITTMQESAVLNLPVVSQWRVTLSGFKRLAELEAVQDAKCAANHRGRVRCARV